MSSIDNIVKCQLAKASLGIEDGVVWISSISDFVGLSKQASASIHKNDSGQLSFSYRGVTFIFINYEFGVSYER